MKPNQKPDKSTEHQYAFRLFDKINLSFFVPIAFTLSMQKVHKAYVFSLTHKKTKLSRGIFWIQKGLVGEKDKVQREAFFVAMEPPATQDLLFVDDLQMHGEQTGRILDFALIEVKLWERPKFIGLFGWIDLFNPRFIIRAKNPSIKLL